MALVLLSGRPGAGKTASGGWLAERQGFIHVETDAEWSTWGPLVCAQNLEAALATLIRARSLGPNVIIEWGFKVALLGSVRQLRSAGFGAWWFDGDEVGARQGYIMRRGASPSVMEEIQAASPELEPFYGDHIIRTVKVGPTYLPFEEIASTMFPDVIG